MEKPDALLVFGAEVLDANLPLAQQVHNLYGKVLLLSMDISRCRLVQDVFEKTGDQVQKALV